jgi:cytoskeletal protein CcmA (bactofilin family)
MAQTADTLPEAKKLYIGEGVTIKGQVSVPDTLVVCGMLEGDMSVGNLIVGESGVIKGRITVSQNAEVSGKVFEKLEVKNLLILRKGSRVDGNVSYGMLQIEQGASLVGGVSSTAYGQDQKTAKDDQPLSGIQGSRQTDLPTIELIPSAPAVAAQSTPEPMTARARPVATLKPASSQKVPPSAEQAV